MACGLAVPSHYLNQSWDIVNWTFGNKFQWNLNRRFYIFIQKNAFGNVIWKMTAILSWPQCVKIATQISSCYMLLYYLLMEKMETWKQISTKMCNCDYMKNIIYLILYMPCICFFFINCIIASHTIGQSTVPQHRCYVPPVTINNHNYCLGNI